MSSVVLTLVAMVAFTANSLLCRLALADGLIDPLLFTTIRLGSGALFLGLWLMFRRSPRLDREQSQAEGSWQGALTLVIYALPFSFAYVSLTTATGALLLFGAVQLTMVGAGLIAGERPSALGWVGLLGAIGGVVYLLFPGLAAPDPLGACLMIASGVGWGLYSIIGKRGGDPFANTSANFIRAAAVLVPLAGAFMVIVAVTSDESLNVKLFGVGLALTSGVVTSALGYAIWYRALQSLSATRAALVQLSVPVIAAALGFVFLAEPITLRIGIAAAIVLTSIAIGVLSRRSAST